MAVRWGPDGYLRPDQFLDHLTVIKINENGESYTAGKNFTLPPAVTTGTNLTSGFSGRQLDVIGQNPIYSRSTKHDWPEKTIGYSAGMQKVVITSPQSFKKMTSSRKKVPAFLS